MNEELFLKEDFFVSDYLPIETEMETLSEEKKSAMKQIYAFAHMMNKSGRMYNAEDIRMQCEHHLLNADKVEKVFKKVFEEFKDEFNIENKPPIFLVKSFLKRNYNLSKNVITGDLVDDNKLVEINDILVKIEESGIKYPSDKTQTLIHSSFVKKVDPMRDYFDSLPPHDGIDYMSILVDCFSVDDQYFFRSMLEKMLVRSIECAIDFEYNRYVFVLSGENQSIGKSKFFSWLNPFGSDYFTSSLPRNDKDLSIALAENFIINIDELAQMSKLDISKIKALISQEIVKERKPYEKQSIMMHRRANFFGTTNSDEFLLDSHNSRWLCFNVTAIDWQRYVPLVPINKLWAQIYSMYLDPLYVSSLTPEERLMQDQRNKNYESNETEKDLIKIYFRKSEDTRHFYTTAEVAMHLQDVSSIKINDRYINRMMQQVGHVRGRKKVNGQYIRGWYVEKIKGAYRDIQDEDQKEMF
ncbi:virulance associated protein E, VirE [Cellulophaga phage phi12:1]|uniref:Virulance associated protein E, VirE n=2 Tax=Cellulophaga phage phi12:1 TaxID=1327976 RepID=R9ZZM5_9CAUD|nr:DNA helicase [Cellulophaga phage phi12:1]AGO47990.1 virulance associated protein E, VirE [Cellulophaga phage phi12:1]AGO48155.1 virulance associated protein E, VirE [Cellulophaga phage phi12:3]